MQSDNQTENKPWLWKKGQSGNLKGRPKGKTLKEYAREYLLKMTDEERDAWLDGLNKELVWKMAEGNPKQDTDAHVDGNINITWHEHNNPLQSETSNAGIPQLNQEMESSSDS